VEVLNDPNFVNVSKLGIDYSDAVIKGTEHINSDVESYIKSSDKLFLDFQPKETYIDAYNEFYDKVF
jgi:starch synthase